MSEFYFSGILGLYSIVHVVMEATKTSNFTRQPKASISILFTCKPNADQRLIFLI